MKVGMRHVQQVYALRKDDHPGLLGSRKSVLGNIAFHCNHKTARCSLRYRTIGDELGVGVRVVERAVPWLAKNGYVALGKRNRRADGTLGAYTFTLLPPARLAAGPPAKLADNLPPNRRRNNQLLEPTASSSTKRRTAEGEEAEEPFEGRTAA